MHFCAFAPLCAATLIILRPFWCNYHLALLCSSNLLQAQARVLCLPDFRRVISLVENIYPITMPLRKEQNRPRYECTACAAVRWWWWRWSLKTYLYLGLASRQPYYIAHHTHCLQVIAFSCRPADSFTRAVLCK